MVAAANNNQETLLGRIIIHFFARAEKIASTTNREVLTTEDDWRQSRSDDCVNAATQLAMKQLKHRFRMSSVGRFSTSQRQHQGVFLYVHMCICNLHSSSKFRVLGRIQMLAPTCLTWWSACWSTQRRLWPNTILRRLLQQCFGNTDGLKRVLWRMNWYWAPLAWRNRHVGFIELCNNIISYRVILCHAISSSQDNAIAVHIYISCLCHVGIPDQLVFMHWFGHIVVDIPNQRIEISISSSWTPYSLGR